MTTLPRISCSLRRIRHILRHFSLIKSAKDHIFKSPASKSNLAWAKIGDFPMFNCRFLIGSGLMLALMTLAAHADGPAPCDCDKGYYERMVTCYKTVIREEKCPTVVRQAYTRYETRPVPVTIMVPREVIVKVPQEVQYPEQQPCMKTRKIPVKLLDPDTGCCIITYKSECYPTTCTVIKTKIVMVDCKKCIQVPDTKTVMQTFPVRDCRDVTVIVTKQHCEQVPYQKLVRIPCPPPGPNYRVPVPLSPNDPLPLPQMLSK
jgi:hypothetical protein